MRSTHSICVRNILFDFVCVDAANCLANKINYNLLNEKSVHERQPDKMLYAAVNSAYLSCIQKVNADWSL